MTEDVGSTIQPWMESVASVLPRPHRSPPVFALGEAVDEMRIWAAFARPESWPRPINQDSLAGDLVFFRDQLGPRLRTIVDGHVDLLLLERKRDKKREIAQDLLEIWRSPDTVRAAFKDLCERAQRDDANSWDLIPLADAIASQIGEASLNYWSPLQTAASELNGNADDWPGRPNPSPPKSLEERVKRAETVLLGEQTSGHVVVWTAYRRAVIGHRLQFGPMSFMRADWFVPNARSETPIEEFDERDEIRTLLENAMWLKDIETEIEDPSNRLVLVRADLGHRLVAGSVQEATRRVEALINIPVVAGGVSWQSCGSSAIMLDGRVVSSSIGTSRPNRQLTDDIYGMGATGDVLGEVAQLLDGVLDREPMPDYLIEAIGAVREAGMTDHRDVTFYGERAVTPRVATALEDHATELIVSFARGSSKELAAELDAADANTQAVSRLLRALMGPIDQSPGEANEDRRSLELLISRYDNGGRRIVNVNRALENADKLLALPMRDLTRRDLEVALQAFQDASHEQAFRASVEAETRNLADRHRRIRNSITHGNPVGEAALLSSRDFSSRRTDAAIWTALNAFSTGQDLGDVIREEASRRNTDVRRMRGGETFLERHPENE